MKGLSAPSLLQLPTAVLLNGILGIDLEVAYGIASLGRPVTNAIVMQNKIPDAIVRFGTSSFAIH